MGSTYNLSNGSKTFSIDRSALEKALKNNKNLYKSLSKINITNDSGDTITYNNLGTRTVDTSTRTKPTTTQDIIEENTKKASTAQDKMSMTDPGLLQAGLEGRTEDYGENAQVVLDNYEANKNDYNTANEAIAKANTIQDSVYDKINDDIEDSKLDEIMSGLDSDSSSYDNILSELDSSSASDNAPTGSSVIDYTYEANYSSNDSDDSDDDDDWYPYSYDDYTPQYTDKSALDETSYNVGDVINDYEIENPFEIKQNKGPLTSRGGYDLNRISRK